MNDQQKQQEFRNAFYDSRTIISWEECAEEWCKIMQS